MLEALNFQPRQVTVLRENNSSFVSKMKSNEMFARVY